jgi:uncharacterized NAD-dependent epimerase/dehydratase family protein
MKQRGKDGKYVATEPESVLKKLACTNFTVPALPFGLQAAIITAIRRLPKP